MTGLQIAVFAVLMLLHGSRALLLPAKSTRNRMSSSLLKKAAIPLEGEPFASTTNNGKNIVFIRHGCTYMNEYLGMPGQSFGSPNFSDVFSSPKELEKHQDAKLSSRGVKQATTMAARFATNKAKKNTSDSINEDFQPSDLDLIVLSPLTRAIQTFELGLLPSFQQQQEGDLPNIVALPLASERVYLISDIGRPRSALEREYKYIDFQSEFSVDGTSDLVEAWWFGLDDKRLSSLPAVATGVKSNTYEEWRPLSQNQKYACPGEPDESFEKRMRSLYRWLGDRPESMIAVVCHWGVIDWMLDQDFLNCQVEVVPFNDIQPVTMVKDESLIAER
jgi:broad specificity phosphatase PhoE